MRKLRSIRPSITLVLALTFTSVTAIALVLVLGMVLPRAGQSTHALVTERINKTLNEIKASVFDHLYPVERLLGFVATSASRDWLDPEVPEAMAQVAADMLATLPQALGMAFIRPDFSADIYPSNGPPQLGEDFSQLPTLPQIMETAVTADGPRWNTPIWSPGIQEPMITVSAPVRRNGEFAGILATAVTVRSLSAFLGEVAARMGQTPFILLNNTHVLAYPGLSFDVDGLGPALPLPPLSMLDDPVLPHLWQRGRSLPRPIRRELEGTAQVVHTPSGGGAYAVMYDTDIEDGGVVVTYGAYTPADQTLGELDTLRTIAIACIGVFIVAIAVSLLIGRAISRPVVRLAEAAEQVKGRHLEDVGKLPRSIIREFNSASTAFNQMVNGLRERQRIRDLFGRYVAPDVVEALLQDPERFYLGGERRDVSLLFTDIAGFTALSESRPPEEVVPLLNTYLEEVCRLVAERGGIVVDFIGDAVFAMFGAPITTDDHAVSAFRAARSIDTFAVDFSHKAEQGGLPFGITRLGLHTGVAMVGNFGSVERLKYGAAGDAVNTAARLEGANRLFGTRMLVSRDTVERVGDVEVRPLARVLFKGKTEAVEVFEPLTEPATAGTASADWLEAYRSAFTLLDHAPTEALRAFESLAEIRPDDLVIRFHLTRLRTGLAAPDIVLAEK